MRLIGRIAALLAISLAVLSCSKGGDGISDFDRSFRAPYAAFSEGLVGSVTPGGWIGEFLQRQRSSMTGYPEAISSPFDPQLCASSADFADGLLRMGYLMDDSLLVFKAVEGIEKTLLGATEDGSPVPSSSDSESGALPMSAYFRVLQTYYQATSDPRIPQYLEKHYLSYSARELASWRDLTSIEGILWTYGITLNPRLLTLAQDIWKMGPFEKNHQDGKALTISDSHEAGFFESLKIPMILYSYTGDEKYLSAAISAETEVERSRMLADGVPSHEGNLSGLGSTATHQTGDISDFAWAMGYFLTATGDASWADRIERAVFNAGPGAVTKDFKAIESFSSVNQFVALDVPGNTALRQAYRPIGGHGCYEWNVYRFMPEFVSRMWLMNGPDGIVSAMFGPSTLKARLSGGIVCTVTESTSYPFEETLRYVFDFSRRGRRVSRHNLSFSFRIPGWAQGVNVRLNGRIITYRADDKGFGHIDRRFRSGDELSVTFDMPVTVHEATNDQGHYIMRGPVLYSYPIPATVIEDSSASEPVHGTPAEGERAGIIGMIPSGPWSYAMAKDAEPQLVQLESDGYPFEPDSAPSRIRIPVKRIIWPLKEDRYTPDSPKGPVVPVSSNLEYIDLVPYGSTCLRLTVIPTLQQ